jgi:hypothetical protein
LAIQLATKAFFVLNQRDFIMPWLQRKSKVDSLIMLKEKDYQRLLSLEFIPDFVLSHCQCPTKVSRSGRGQCRRGHNGTTTTTTVPSP